MIWDASGRYKINQKLGLKDKEESRILTQGRFGGRNEIPAPP